MWTILCLKKHNIVHKNTASKEVSSRERPIRIAAQRQRELLAAIIADDNLEWIDEDEVDIQDLQIPNMAHTYNNNPIPIVSLDDNLSIPWDNQ